MSKKYLSDNNIFILKINDLKIDIKNKYIVRIKNNK